jgi:putative phosphoribosyl transferase
MPSRAGRTRDDFDRVDVSRKGRSSIMPTHRGLQTSPAGMRLRARPRGASRAVTIPPLGLPGTLTLPEQAAGVVLFAHGSGSSRLSPRNIFVADGLHAAGIGTLVFDLLTEHEAEDRTQVFDISLLAERLLEATAWIASERETETMKLGYFGASTGAAAALVAAASSPWAIAAVVSRGGRPDLAGDIVRRVASPTLLIVGERDSRVLELNRRAFRELRCEKLLRVVADATHLFEEPGTLDEVVDLACNWFEQHFQAASAARQAIPA